ncbi:MAG TPA: DUF4157 domain-containing protein [Methanotrichaceae archaeon]|nr:DUF4157 domain-containing protein [Methanotrichaceae archaeon]
MSCRFAARAAERARRSMLMNSGTLQRKCDRCLRKKPSSQSSAARASPDSAPPVVHDVLRSPGKPLDARTRDAMESRFGRDFSRVKVHTDARAAESASAVNALAYTVGQNVVFRSGQYMPDTSRGQRLLAHELTHVAQQGGRSTVPATLNLGSPEDIAEHDADQMAHSPAGSESRLENRSVPVQVQRQSEEDQDPLHGPLIEQFRKERGLPPGGKDEFGQSIGPTDVEIKYSAGPLAFAAGQANAIIAKAKDQNVPLNARAIEAVNGIIREYYDPSMVSEVVYSENERGLATSPVGKGKDIRGRITVGKYFIEHIDSFARRVLQVGHEMQHVEQQRQGMGGEKNKNKREFLAFYWEGLATERLGTGQMPDATRRDLIDAALGNYNCLSQDEQKANAGKRDELLKRRVTVNGTHGNPSTQPPSDCRR